MSTKPGFDPNERRGGKDLAIMLRRYVAGPAAAAVLCSFSVGCREQSMPKGVGASGKSIQVSPDSVNKVPEEALSPKPGSGLGGGGGDAQGRLRNPAVAGKAEDHEPGSRKKEKSTAAPKPGSGKGGGGGDAEGKSRNPDVAGKAKDHEPGSRKKAGTKKSEQPTPPVPTKDAKQPEPEKTKT